MYANAPHASASTPPLSAPQHTQQHPPAAQHGLPHGLPPAHQGGSYGMPPAAAIHHAHPAPVAAPQRATAFVTGAYQSSGDPAIDRMLRLEAACKRFGSPI